MATGSTSGKSFRQLVHNARGYRYLLVLSLICMMIGVAGTLGISMFIRYSVDAMFAGDSQLFFSQFLRFALLSLIITVATFGERFFVGHFAEATVADLRGRLAAKLSRLPISYLDNQHSGDLISRLTNDANLVHEFLFHQLVPLLFLPVMGVVALAYLLIISWQLTLVSIAGTPLLGVLVTLVAKPMSSASKGLQESLGEINSLVQDATAGSQEIKAFNLQRSLADRFRQKVTVSIQRGLSLAKQRSLMRGVSSLAGVTPFLICFGYGGYLAVNQVVTLGAFIAFINLLNHISNPLNSLPHLIGQYHTAMAASARLHELLELAEERQDGREFSGKETPVVEFRHVQFGYNGTPVLNDVSFTIQRGETVALVGPSGSGKSTILKLLAGFYTPQAGEIRVFGHPIDQWKLAAMRRRMALVTQDTYLYPTTIRENIAYGSPGASHEEIVQAAQLANAHQFITEQPVGYDTVVGERGSRLSGGQKQRIAIARAILRDAEILLLDEPTSALDTESEHLVQQALEPLMREKTTITIAHRLSTIKNADRILVIEQGRVVEEGTHQELLAEEGVYYELYRSQLANEQGADEHLSSGRALG